VKKANLAISNKLFSPFRQAGWFCTAAGLAVLGFGATKFRLRERGKRADRAGLESQMAARTKELSALNAIAETVSQSLDLSVTLDTALEKILQVMKIDGGGIYLLDERGEALKIAAQRGLSPELVEKIDMLRVGEGFSGEVVLSGKPLVVKDIAEDARLTRMAVVEAGIHSVTVVPLSSKGKVPGTLFVVTHGQREFSGQDIELLTSIGRQIGMAIENARLYEETKKKLAQLAALQETTRAVVSTLELDALLNLIIQQASNLLHAEGGILNLVDWKKRDDEVYACTGITSGVLGGRTPLDGSLSGWVTLHNQPVISNQIQHDRRVDRNSQDLVRQLHNAAIAPLSIKDRVIGTLVVVDKLGGREDFTQADLDLLFSFANQATNAIENARLYTGERRRAEQFRAIAEVSRRLTLILDETELLQQVVRVIQQIFGYYHVGIGLLEGDELVYRVGAGALWDDPDFQFKPGRLKIGKEGISGWVAATAKPYLLADVNKDPRYVRMEGSATCSELIVPIFIKEKVAGVLDVQSDQLNAFDETDLEVFQSLADQAGAAIENARLFYAEERQTEQFRVIGEVGQRIASAFNVDELLDQMAKMIQQSFGYYHVGIGLIEGDEVVSKAEVGASEDAYHSVRIRLGEGSWGWVAQHGEPYLSADVRNDPHFHAGPGTEDVRSHLCVPLKSKAEVIGVISVASDRLKAFDENDVIVLQTLANQAAAAVENIRYYERAQRLAVMEERSRLARELHDAVTQTIFSASLLAEALPEIWEKDANEGRQVVQELRGLSRGALAEMRTLLLELRPSALTETHLEDLLRQLGEAASGREGIPVNVSIEGQGVLPTEVHIAFYRIAQEALNNVVKHAQASQVIVRLCYSCMEEEDPNQAPGNSALLIIRDDGCGFDPALVLHDHLGLRIMRERAQAIGASITLDSHPGEGTQVTVLWEYGAD
jgi:GAF domain-containing protein